MVKKFGELPLVIAGALCFAGSLFAIPFVGPQVGGLLALLLGGGIFSMGNSLATPALNEPGVEERGRRRAGKRFGSACNRRASLARRGWGQRFRRLLMSQCESRIGAPTARRIT